MKIRRSSPEARPRGRWWILALLLIVGSFIATLFFAWSFSQRIITALTFSGVALALIYRFFPSLQSLATTILALWILMTLPFAILKQEGATDTTIPPPSALPPQFPWPPPRPSGLSRFDLGLSTTNRFAVYRDLENSLREALLAGGYDTLAFFEVPDGFAVVTSMERIDLDGSPAADRERWHMGQPVRVRQFSVGDYLRQLFDTESGRFRVFVVVVSPHPLDKGATGPEYEWARRWIIEGLPALPDQLATREVTPQHAVTGLIYEFKKLAATHEAVQVIPSEIPAGQHFERSKILIKAKPL